MSSLLTRGPDYQKTILTPTREVLLFDGLTCRTASKTLGVFQGVVVFNTTGAAGKMVLMARDGSVAEDLAHLVKEYLAIYTRMPEPVFAALDSQGVVRLWHYSGSKVEAKQLTATLHEWMGVSFEELAQYLAQAQGLQPD